MVRQKKTISSGLYCPKCKKSIMDVHVRFTAEDSWEFSVKEKCWIPYSLCPDQGYVTFYCQCGKKLSMSVADPNSWEQEELDDQS